MEFGAERRLTAELGTDLTDELTLAGKGRLKTVDDEADVAELFVRLCDETDGDCFFELRLNSSGEIFFELE